jgi:hypothetical protein
LIGFRKPDEDSLKSLIREQTNFLRYQIPELRLIARDAAVTAELWIRSKHGTWRFFLVTPNSLAGIDQEGKRIESGQTLAYLAGKFF